MQGQIQSTDPPDSLTDDQIVARVRAGDVALFELLMRRHNRRVYRTVRAILHNDGDAEDVMQESYVNAYAKLADFAGRASFSTWLLRIAIHEAFARRRRGLRLTPLDTAEKEVVEMAAPTRGPEASASDHELGLLLEKAVDRLPEGFRTVFVLRAVEQLSGDETAEVLGIPEETVKTRLHRARGLLKKELSHRVGAALPSLFDFHFNRCDRIVARVFDRLREGSR